MNAVVNFKYHEADGIQSSSNHLTMAFVTFIVLCVYDFTKENDWEIWNRTFHILIFCPVEGNISVLQTASLTLVCVKFCLVLCFVRKYSFQDGLFLCACSWEVKNLLVIILLSSVFLLLVIYNCCTW